MTVIAIIIASILAALATRLFYTRKIARLNATHEKELRSTFTRAFDAGYANGNVDGQHMILLENITAKAQH